MSFNAAFERIYGKWLAEDKARREAELLNTAECAKTGMDPLDAIMPTRPDGKRDFRVIEPHLPKGYRRWRNH
jgi:hypothetical protein